MFETLIFSGLSVAFGLLLWFDRVSLGEKGVFRLLRTFLLIAIPFAAFVAALAGGEGDQLTVRIMQLRIPQSVVVATEATRAEDGTEAKRQDTAAPEFQPFLIVGDSRDSADLVVPPYADQSLSRISMPADPRAFVTVRAKAPSRPADSDAVMKAEILLQSFAPQSDQEIPGMGVKIGGTELQPGAPETRELIPGEPIELTVSRIDLDGKWAPRRSFTLYLRGGDSPVIELNLNEPLVADAGSCKLPRLRLSPAAGGDGQEPEFLDPDNLVFTGLGLGGANPVAEAKWLGPVAEPSSLCAKTDTDFAWPSGVEAADARLSLHASKVFLPVFSGFFVIFCALAMHALCAAAWRKPTPERVLVPLVQWLLALRLLIGVAGLYYDSRQGLTEVLWDPLASFLCLPMLIVLAFRQADADLRPMLSAFLLLLLAGFTAIAIALGGVAWGGLPAALFYTTGVAVTARLVWPGRESPLALACALLGALLQAPGGKVPRREKGIWQRVRPMLAWIDRLPRTYTLGIAIIVAMVAFRLFLLLIGAYLLGSRFSERPFGVPLSLIYVPAMILGFALLLDGTQRLRKRGFSTGLMLVLFLAAYGVVPWLTHDFGSMLVYGIPLAVAIAWFGFRDAKGLGGIVKRWPWLMPLAMAPTLVALFALGIALSGEIPSPQQKLNEHLAATSEWDRNDIRMLAYLWPSRVEQIGTTHAFESLDQTTSLGPLTREMIGHGYLAQSNIQQSLRKYQYSDNLAAVHIIWPWGRLGALAVLAVILAGMLALRPRDDAEVGDDTACDWPRIAGVAARITFFWAAAYMVLANLNWVPFTGRNIYLLAVTSGGDLAEAMAVLLLTALPFVCGRPTGETPGNG